MIIEELIYAIGLKMANNNAIAKRQNEKYFRRDGCIEKKQKIKKTNKYAIYAYTHGPVNGSGPSVVTLLLLGCS